MRILVVPSPGVDGELEKRLRGTVSKRLEELGVREPRVVVERRGGLARSAGGKLQMVVAGAAVRQAC